MLRWFRRKLKSLGRGFLVAMASLWLVAAAEPCVMAQTHPTDAVSSPCLTSKGMAHAAMTDMKDCGPVTTVNCQLPDINTPLVATLGDFTVTPVLLTTLPVSMILPQTRQHPQNDFFTPDIPAPPLHIQHLTLIL
ncbi:MAG: hypothetical protein ACYC9J_02225 [Sulfuricaulis sp.]